MQLSAQAVAALVDLVEIKLSCMDIWDRDDRREALMLQRCLRELKGVAGIGAGPVPAGVLEPERRRGRRPRAELRAAG